MIGAALTCVGLSVLLAAPATVERWSTPQALVGELDRVDAQGLSVRPGGAAVPVHIPWHDVRAVPLNAQQQRDFGPLMLDAWRAHARLARGDYPGALGIYARLAPDYLWAQGPQSMDVSAGLMRCLLDQGQRVRALTPMLSWFVAAQTHAPGQGASSEGYDASYALMTQLPPVFTAADRREAPPELPESAPLTERERFIHACYVLALTPGEGEKLVEQIEARRRALGPGRDPGVELLEDMVFALAHPEPERRQAARRDLDRRVRVGEGTWVEAWARLGLGQALLHDPDPALNELGVLHLIHVIVRLRELSPAMAVLAARVSDEHLRSTDHAQWGAQLLHDATRVGEE